LTFLFFPSLKLDIYIKDTLYCQMMESK